MTGNDDLEHISSEGETVVDSPTSSAILDVFSNRDLMRSILQTLRDMLDTPDLATARGAPTLWQKEFNRLLLVSQGFFGIAIEFLWESMHSLLPCFSLIPSFKANDTGYVSGRPF